jgi:hypothetical protein
VLIYLWYDFHRHDANYEHDGVVDYLDYADDYRFRRVEKHLASERKVSNPPPEANLGWVFFFYPSSEITPAINQERSS